MKNDAVFSRAHRIFKGIPAFHFITGNTSSDPFWLALDGNLHADEILIGIYKNPAEELGSVVVSNCRIWIFLPGETNYIDYRSITRIEIPEDVGKSKLDYLIVYQTNGSTRNVYITGGNDKLRDVYSFVQFLDRVKSGAMG